MASATSVPAALRTTSLYPCARVVEVAAGGEAAVAVHEVLRGAGFLTATAMGRNRPARTALCVVQVANAVFGSRDGDIELPRATIRDTAERMIRAGGGRMVLITDALPWPAAQADAEQAARQAAELHWWQQLAARVAPHGVLLNTIRVGYAPFLGHRLTPEVESDLLAHQVIRRPVTGADLAGALILLYSRGLTTMVGEVLPLDGGLEAAVVPMSPPGTVRIDRSTEAPADLWSLAGRTVLVTGASSGIGEETAIELARRGADLVLVARRTDQLNRVRNAIREHLSTRVHIVRADLAEPGAAARMVRQAWDEAGEISDLVYAAGVLARDDLADGKGQREDSYRINVLSYADAAEELARRWASTKHRGAIVGVSSTSAHSAPVPGLYSYGSSKAASAQLGAHLAMTLSRHRIRVNTVLPGIVRTPMTDTADPAFVTKSLSRVPLGRLSDPDDVAAAISYLVSPASSFLTGAQLRVCGGWVTLKALPPLGIRDVISSVGSA
ncbi:SDR family oxidoreductase [Saccharomonospora sp. NPDC006951]